MLYDAKRRWLFLVEAVTSHGPVSPTRLVDPGSHIGRVPGVDPASLCELEDAVAREPVVPGSRCGFLEDAALGNLPFAALIDSGDPGIDGSALSQLNPLGCAVGNRLILLGR